MLPGKTIHADEVTVTGLQDGTLARLERELTQNGAGVLYGVVLSGDAI